MRKIVVVGNTHAEAKQWAQENLTHPYVTASSGEWGNLEGLRVLAVMFTPNVRTVSRELWENLRRLKVMSGVNEHITVD